MENPRSRSRSPRPDSWLHVRFELHFRFVQPDDASLYQDLPAAELGPQVRWLVDQGPEWKGFYRDAKYFGAHLEEMYQKNVEIADGELVFHHKQGNVEWVHWYRHQMIKGNPMTQTRYRDQHRQHVMYVREIVRVIMQRSREDMWCPRIPPRP